MIQGAIFDADGTLLDSMGMWDTVGERYLASLGVTARPGLRQILFPLSLSQCAAYLRESYGLSLSVDAIEVASMVPSAHFIVSRWCARPAQRSFCRPSGRGESPLFWPLPQTGR